MNYKTQPHTPSPFMVTVKQSHHAVTQASAAAHFRSTCKQRLVLQRGRFHTSLWMASARTLPHIGTWSLAVVDRKLVIDVVGGIGLRRLLRRLLLDRLELLLLHRRLRGLRWLWGLLQLHLRVSDFGVPRLAPTNALALRSLGQDNAGARG